MLFFRVAVAVAVLNAALLPVLARFSRRHSSSPSSPLALAWRSLRGSKADAAALKNPLQLLSAVEMALLFQVVLFAVYYMRAVGG